MIRDADTLERLRDSRLLLMLQIAAERCHTAETLDALDKELDGLARVVDAISDLLLDLD